MATIKPIESRSVHQIQSGQVIVDLNSVVKELVENSLDAGATSIEVRFKNHGLDSIEVSDNGKGIAPEDFEGLALKHYTSKLASYDDLAHLQTFGFRGEALSSLCALSKFHVVTARAEDGALGRKLEFEVSGKLKSTSALAATKGTTVVVENLFSNLPVRRKELEKNIKREYGKVLTLLYAYACIGIGVKYTVTNVMSKTKRTLVFSTQGNATTRDNIANVYGAKMLSGLIKLDLELEMQSTSFSKHSEEPTKVHIEGHISKPVFGEGRQAPDRQMYFVNSRPCSLPQVAKAFNEVYRSFNLSQSPFVFANLSMDTDSYDVNVSPDKRTVMLHDQGALLESLKTALIGMFEEVNHTVPQSNVSQGRLPGFKSAGSLLRREESTLDSSRAHSSCSEDEDDTDPNRSILTDFAPINRDARKDSQKDTWEHKATALISSVDGNSSADLFVSSSEEMQDDTERYNLSSNPSRNTLLSFRVPSPELPSRFPETEGEQPIPASSPSLLKASPGPVQSAFNRMRPKRSPLQTAEVTIGDTTTTAVLGSGSTDKRRRVHYPRDQETLFRFMSSPLLARGLQGFAAPGSDLSRVSSGGLQRTMDFEDPKRSDSGRSESDISDQEDDASENEAEFDQPPTEVDGSSQEMERPHSSGSATPSVPDGDFPDDEYVDEAEKKAEEEAKVAKLIQEAQLAAARPTEANARRSTQVLKNGWNRKGVTLNLSQTINTTIEDIRDQIAADQQLSQMHHDKTDPFPKSKRKPTIAENIDDSNAENRLSLTIVKSDFNRMRIIGQFNLGFILALRPALTDADEDELFIIDQHAADEKFNYERLQRTTTLQSQRLVQPKPLDLTALEEEIILNNSAALKANGFEIAVPTSTSTWSSNPNANSNTGPKPNFNLLTLPMSKEKTFDLSDLEELLHLLSESPSHATSATTTSNTENIPRPRKVQRMLAMRACRSSIMIGRTLTNSQMQRVVRNMGEMDKPWNCPHGRPTMRHLASLQAWNGWMEGDLLDPPISGG